MRLSAGLAAAAILAAVMLAPAGVASGREPSTRLKEPQAAAVAKRDPKVLDQKRLHPGLTNSGEFKDGRWEIGFYDGDNRVAIVMVDDITGQVEESWTGYQVAWKMARGYSGAFGHKLNAPYVFLPLCILFLAGLIDWRRIRRVANLDLLVLLGFGVSHIFFSRAEIGVSTPLIYPVLTYVLSRMLWIGFKGRGEGLRPVWPAAVLVVAALFLVGVRVGLNVADSGVSDIGYASVVGADRTTHGEDIYGNFPGDVSQGDTYGPFTYYAYVPFEIALPWSGSWDDIPAAHFAAVVFDLLAFFGLLLLGNRIRPGPEGRMLGATLAFGWASYPYTGFALEANSNDTLVAVLLIGILLLIARPLARGAMIALAALAKFAPVVLIPMLARYRPPEVTDAADQPGLWSRTPPIARFGIGLILTTVIVLGPTLLGPGLITFYERTLGYQNGRGAPFSIWGLEPWLGPLRILLLLATAALTVLLAFRPRRLDIVQVAALGAALIIALQITAEYWFYLYIVWFVPLVLVALAAVRPEPEPAR